MKEFMLLIRNHADHQSEWSSEKHRQFLQRCEIYIGTLTSNGSLLSAQPMVRDGVMISQTNGSFHSGPFSNGKEVIVGYYHILAADLNEAVTIAKSNPEFEFSSTARVEVRPVKMDEKETGFIYPK